ncbi:pyruvate carboxylase [Flaviaesturariibacter flavus]|uniref:Pyruvate carboxylase n=1 Tax=Flaviaesturariibacter flavus TaxID=2502780 RepID=A0A4R1B791_9BACT|nr:pyruvate carboxylase [Flaviaesturariibacter flavus]TCJ12055.1 pyruvate carboxylase [Flaviaesturariibacter flavus]
MEKKIAKLLVANRGEIAIRVLRACSELEIRTVAIYTFEDRYSLHRYKADEAYQVGRDDDPLKPYLDIEAILAIARDCGAEAIHPGYGFLSENYHFAQRCREEGIVFIGPDPEVMQQLGDKVLAKNIARKCGVPMIESSQVPLDSLEAAQAEAARIGFPLMLKAAAGGGGRGMRVIRSGEELEKSFPEARREAKNAFGDDTVFFEKFIEQPKHIEVQVVADRHGNVMHLYERDCSLQRRFQKIVEVAPAFDLPQQSRQKLYDYAVQLCREVGYNNVGTVEFLVDTDGEVYFIEVNPRIQVEHTVTEMVTGFDIVKTQIRIAEGYPLHGEVIGFPAQDAVPLNGYAIQCRITTEDPENDFMPDYGTVLAYRSAEGFGIRLDEGSVYNGVKISPFFDSLLVKVTAHSSTVRDAVQKLRRALNEFRIRGVKTNIRFLLNIITHPEFIAGRSTVNFLQQHPEVFTYRTAQDRGTRILRYLADISVNGHPDVKHPDKRKVFEKPIDLPFDKERGFADGTKQLLQRLGPEGLAQWLLQEKPIHYTDTTYRDAHQSLLATRVRTTDMLKAASSFAQHFPQTFSMEVWGGATFDVCMRFLYEDPWERLRLLRAAIPNILLQMLLRGANAVGYKAYPDNLVEEFVVKSWETGIDVFRIFDSLNWMPNMEKSIGAVRMKTGAVAEVAMCYTGDIQDPSRTKYTLQYYKQFARDIENAGAHILAVKDMSGLLKPMAAYELVSELKQTVKIPIHLHTHDTSSLQAATYLKAIEAGVDVVDGAIGALSGLTSQPNLNALVEMMRFQERELPYDIETLNKHSTYWEAVREYYYPFESGLKASSAEVFYHEIPGGQYSNLKPQAQSLGLGDHMEDIKKAYREVNELFGDIVKVTPSSKVVGDMALFMVSNNLRKEDILERGHTLSFPESVVSLFRGDIGQPVGGFDPTLQKIILRDIVPYTERPNEHLEPVDFEATFADFKKLFGEAVTEKDLLSWLLYPKVFEEYWQKRQAYGELWPLPTPNFFYGLRNDEEVLINIDRGKSILVRLLTCSEPDAEGKRKVFLRLNGQTRIMEVQDASIKTVVVENEKAQKNNPGHIAAPLQGKLSQFLIKEGQEVKLNQPLFVIEAMKMETTITATRTGKVGRLVLPAGKMVKADDLVLTLE